ncbi:hypothetical protein HU200_062621 [Digitaria exilis]|uniref:Uncharacterized protein n=1 Tax=Digitaria exilis TaxID=1010633 RepID=A0A835A700_9POAL|nr:hypothetical protein HU200_062621 [Digitaria exilis]
MASSSGTKPLPPPAGDPPAALHSTPRLSGDPPAATSAVSPCLASPGQAPVGCHLPATRSGSGHAVDLHYCPSDSSTASPPAADLKGKAPALETEEVTSRSVLQPCASFREALVGVRTFKPRFDASKRPDEWNDNSARKKQAPSSVWRPTPPAPKASVVPEAASPPTPAMDFIPGESWRRPSGVVACAARTSDVKEAEHELMLHALVAVQMDARARLSCDEVLRDALQQLRISSHVLRVSRTSSTSFILHFQSPDLRNTALQRGILAARRSALHLMPWNRHVGAADSLGRLFYRVRVCLEGVPEHAHFVESVMHMLPEQSFVEEIDYVREREDEKGCFILWIWCKDPDAIKVLGTLQIQEPEVMPDGCSNYNVHSQFPLQRAETVALLNYEVLIHLDRVEDYNRPADDPITEWPVRHRFDWQLGQPDAIPHPSRTSVHSRLGGRRDRSPSRDGGAGGSRFMPPPNQQDRPHSNLGGTGPTGMQNRWAGGYQGHHRCRGDDSAHVMETERASWIETRLNDDIYNLDPMLEEANLPPSSGSRLPLASQRSVEPTVTDRVVTVPDFLTGDGTYISPAKERNTILELELPDPAVSKDDSPRLFSPQGNGQANDILELMGMGVTSPGSSEPMFGKLFDLNQNYETVEGEMQEANEVVEDINIASVQEGKQMGREVLGPVEDRLNKHGKDHSGHGAATRGLTRIAIPLKKSLLCGPPMKPKMTHSRKNTGAVEAAQVHHMRKGQKGTCSTIDEKATTLLMKTSGIYVENEQPSQAAHEQFRGQFVSTMQGSLISDYRVTFGMSEIGEPDNLAVLIGEAGADDA